MCAGQDPECSYPDLSPAGTRRVAFVVGERRFQLSGAAPGVIVEVAAGHRPIRRMPRPRPMRPR